MNLRNARDTEKTECVEGAMALKMDEDGWRIDKEKI